MAEGREPVGSLCRTGLRGDESTVGCRSSFAWSGDQRQGKESRRGGDGNDPSHHSLGLGVRSVPSQDNQTWLELSRNRGQKPRFRENVGESLPVNVMTSPLRISIYMHTRKLSFLTCTPAMFLILL